jgi:hypothetical protein
MRASSFLLLAARSASAATVTFIVAPDTHFTTCGGVPDVEKNLRGVKEMNQLPGTPFPADSKWGGSVESNIRAVVVAGDIIDDGCNSNPANTTVDPGCAAQLGNYTDMFPIESGVQRPTAVRFPTLEGAGNHDGGNSTDAATGLLRRTLIERNRQRVARPDAPPKYRLSPNGLHYSWEWEGVHFVMLGVYPGTDGDCASGKALPGTGCDPAHPPYGWHCPEFSLSFLEADLKTVDKGTPLVLFMHYGLTGFGAPGVPPWSGYSPDFWWSAREAAAFASVLRGHHVAALIHGHTHACAFYTWDLSNVTGQVIDVYNAPSLQKGGKDDPDDPSVRSQFLVFELDTTARRLRVFQRVGNDWGTIKHEKSLDGTTLASMAPALQDEVQDEAQVWVAHETAAVGQIHVRAKDEPITPSWVMV